MYNLYVNLICILYYVLNLSQNFLLEYKLFQKFKWLLKPYVLFYEKYSVIHTKNDNRRCRAPNVKVTLVVPRKKLWV